MLEVWKAAGAFEELESYLEDTGFFGHEDVVADVFFGYGLSDGLRRAPWPGPPAPCRLPLLAARVSPAGEPAPAPRPFRIGEWRRSWDDEGYAAAIEAVQDAIARGDGPGS